MFDEPAAQNGTKRGGHGGKARPRADGMAASLLVKRGADDCEAAGYEECRPQSLNASGNDEQMNIGGESASQRSRGEDGHAHQKDETASKQIAERAADENQSAEEQSVRRDDPLHIHDGGLKAGLEGGQSDVDHGAIDEGHAGAKNGGREDPGARVLYAGNVEVSGFEQGFIARWSHVLANASEV